LIQNELSARVVSLSEILKEKAPIGDPSDHRFDSGYHLSSCRQQVIELPLNLPHLI
jgi:hypothetical protein